MVDMYNFFFWQMSNDFYILFRFTIYQRTNFHINVSYTLTLMTCFFLRKRYSGQLDCTCISAKKMMIQLLNCKLKSKNNLLRGWYIGLCFPCRQLTILRADLKAHWFSASYNHQDLVITDHCYNHRHKNQLKWNTNFKQNKYYILLKFIMSWGQKMFPSLMIPENLTD